MNSQNLEKASFLYKSTKFSVIHGNIVLERSNIIVNAANEDLWLGAGVAGAIDTAAGSEVQAACYEIIRKKGTLNIGDCVYTGSGNLFEKQGIFYVVHAIGPKWKGGFGDEFSDLRSCVIKALDILSALKMKSISFPAISSGIFGFPKEICAEIMIHAAIDFVKEKEAQNMPKIDEIRFTNFDSETVAEFQKVFQKAEKSLI